MRISATIFTLCAFFISQMGVQQLKAGTPANPKDNTSVQTGSQNSGETTKIPPAGYASRTVQKRKADTHYLYIPLVIYDDDYHTYLGLTNPSDSETAYTVESYQPDGTLIREEPGTLDPHARTYLFLNGVEEDYYWIRIAYDNELDAYANMVSPDLQDSAFVKASTSLEHQLYVPHIAPEIDYWNSYSSIVNATNMEGLFTFDYLNGTVDLPMPTSPFEQYFLEWYDDLLEPYFDDMFYWGIVKPSGESEPLEPMLVGMEAFTRKGEARQLGALDLQNNESDVLYFAHIDTGGGYWWTGMVIENISDATIQVDFIPYKADGTELTKVTFEMEPNEKLVNVVETFWTDEGVDFPADTAWIKVVSSGGNIIGFELFGTIGENNRLLTGINGATGGSAGLLFPHVQVSEDFWTGITFVNVSDTDATVQLTAYGDDGTHLGDSDPFVVAPNAKKVDVAQNFFTDNQIPEGTTHVVAWSDQPIVGFEIWGNLVPQQDYISGMLGTELPPPSNSAYAYSFEYESTGVTCWDDGWELAVFNDNTDEYNNWLHAGENVFSKAQGWNDVYPQTVPDGIDYMLGFYGDSGTRVHQGLVSPPITLPDDVSTVSFYSQFGYPGDATVSDYFYISQDTTLENFFNSATLLNEFSIVYIGTLPMSSEVDIFTEWKKETFDISAFAGQTVRFMFELDSSYGESWHIDMIEIMTLK